MKLYFKEGVGTDFWASVKSGSKTHTCRKRAVKIGAALTLICGGESIIVSCTGVQTFKTELAPYGVIAIVDGVVMAPDRVDELSARSGFKSREAMFEYYGENFNGHIIHWGKELYESIH